MNVRSFIKTIMPIVISVFLLLLITVYTYKGLINTFFQQDEWQYFGSNIYALLTNHPILNVILPFRGQLTHFFPLATLFFLLEYKMFHVNFVPYAYVAIGLHLLNGILLFVLIRKILKNTLIAFCSTCLFLVNSISHQAITWIAAGIGTFQATGLIICSLIFFADFLEKKKLAYLFISVLFLTISLLFKEISIFLFIYYPLVMLIYFMNSLKNNLDFIKKSSFLFLGFAGAYVLLRTFFFLFQSVRSAQPETGDAGTYSSVTSIATYLFRIITIPLKGVAQSFIPQKQLIDISDNLVKLAYPNFVGLDNAANPYISQTIVFDLVCFIFFVAISIAIVFLIRFLLRKKEKKLGYLLLFSLFFLISSFFPYAFIPGKAGYFSIFEPRNLYIASLVTGLIISISILTLAKFVFKTKLYSYIFLSFFIGLLLTYNMSTVLADIGKLEHTGRIRESLLNEVKDRYPKLGMKSVIYTVSDRSYYGMPMEEKILPLQSGFGRMILVWYQDSEHFPSCLYENLFLHGLRQQEYKECDGRGFGYFRDYAKLKDTVKIYKIPLENIIAFSWNGDKESFTDITKNIREKLSTGAR